MDLPKLLFLLIGQLAPLVIISKFYQNRRTQLFLFDPAGKNIDNPFWLNYICRFAQILTGK